MSGLLEAGVAVATALSIGLLALMLAAPWLPDSTAANPEASAAVTPSPAPEVILPPIGLYASREPMSLGPCFAIELRPESYPVGEAADGVASVLWWERGMTGCDSRSTDVMSVDATVTPLETSDDPDAESGYSVTFRLSGTPGDIEVAILPPDESEPSLLQALDLTTSGTGLVLDRVTEVEPALDPLPSGS